jgi:hypothetical protein
MTNFRATMKDVEQVRAFVQAMRDQGFNVYGTYEPHESEARAATGKLEHYTVMCLARDGNSICTDSNEVDVCAWGDDGLAVKIDYRDTSNILERLKKAKEVCGTCNKHAPETFRYDFAGRMCRECRMTHKEPAGWRD